MHNLLFPLAHLSFIPQGHVIRLPPPLVSEKGLSPISPGTSSFPNSICFTSQLLSPWWGRKRCPRSFFLNPCPPLVLEMTFVLVFFITLTFSSQLQLYVCLLSSFFVSPLNTGFYRFLLDMKIASFPVFYLFSAFLTHLCLQPGSSAWTSVVYIRHHHLDALQVLQVYQAPNWPNALSSKAELFLFLSRLTKPLHCPLIKLEI